MRKILTFLNKAVSARLPVEATDSETIISRHSLANGSQSEDLVRRSFQQYLCHCDVYGFKRKLWLAYPLLWFAVLSYYLVYPILCLIFKDSRDYSDVDDVALVSVTALDFVPDQLKSIYKISGISEAGFIFDFSLYKSTFVLIPYIVFEPFFVLKNVLAVLKVGAVRVACKAYINSCEYSFSSSFLTWVLNRHDIKHINVMHGEKLYDAVDAYAAFDEYWVWDERYVRLLTSMNVIADFEVDFPSNMDLTVPDYCGECLLFIMQGDESPQFIDSVILKLKEVRDRLGLQYIYVKQHPRYPTRYDFSKREDIFLWSGDLNSALSQSRVVVARHSTVIYLCYRYNRYQSGDKRFYLYLLGYCERLHYIMAGEVDGVL